MKKDKYSYPFKEPNNYFDAFEERLKERLSAEKQNNKKRYKWIWWSGAAASILIILTVFSLYHLKKTTQITPEIHVNYNSQDILDKETEEILETIPELDMALNISSIQTEVHQISDEDMEIAMQLEDEGIIALDYGTDVVDEIIITEL